MRRIVARLGENGYVAVDNRNQVDMVGAEQAIAFCKAVDEKKFAVLTNFLEEDFVLTLSDGTEHTALRVLPLDETCRELNRKYIYPVLYEQPVPYAADENLGAGAVYQIPEEIFAEDGKVKCGIERRRDTKE